MLPIVKMWSNWNFLHIAGGNARWYTYLETGSKFLKTLDNHPTKKQFHSEVFTQEKRECMAKKMGTTHTFINRMNKLLSIVIQ